MNLNGHIRNTYKELKHIQKNIISISTVNIRNTYKELKPGYLLTSVINLFKKILEIPIMN